MKYKGVKKLAEESKCLTGGYYSGEYMQINYDKTTHEVWGDYFVSLGQNSWNVYHDENIIRIGNICNPVTMAEIAEMIENSLAEEAYIKAYLQSCDDDFSSKREESGVRAEIEEFAAQKASSPSEKKDVKNPTKEDGKKK